MRGLFLERLIFGGAYLRRENCVSKSNGLAFYVEVNLLFLLCFTLHLRAIFQVQAPGGLYLEGQCNRGFFALPVWGGLYLEGLIQMEGLIFRILRYFKFLTNSETCPLHREGQKMITNGRDQ